MAFSFVGYVNASASGTSLTVNVPSGVQNGDLLILFGTGYCSGTVTIPGGFANTVVSPWAGAASATNKCILAYRVASSEPASYTVTASATWYPGLLMYAVRGGDTVTPIVQTVKLTNATRQTTLPAASLVSPLGTSLLIYGYGGANQGHSGTNGLSLPSPGTLLTGSSTGTIAYSSGGVDFGILACTGTPGSASSTTAVDEASWAIEYAAGAAAFTPEPNRLSGQAVQRSYVW